MINSTFVLPTRLFRMKRQWRAEVIPRPTAADRVATDRASAGGHPVSSPGPTGLTSRLDQGSPPQVESGRDQHQ